MSIALKCLKLAYDWLMLILLALVIAAPFLGFISEVRS